MWDWAMMVCLRKWSGLPQQQMYLCVIQDGCTGFIDLTYCYSYVKKPEVKA